MADLSMRTAVRETGAPNPDRILARLAGANADGDVPTAYGTRLATDPEPCTIIHVVVTYVSPVLPDDTMYLIADGIDGQGRVLIAADGQDFTDAHRWLARGSARIQGRRTEILGTVGLEIRRAAM